MRHLRTALAALAILGAPAAAQAATTFYTDLASFQAAAGATSFESFEGLPSTSSVIATPDVIVTCATTFFCLDTTYAFATDGAVAIGAYGGGLTFTFNAPVRAFALDVIGLATAGFPSDFQVRIGSAPPVTVYANQFNTQFDNTLFAGLVSDTLLSQVTVTGTDGNDFVAYDSLRYGPGPAISTAAVPEPTGWALMLLGAGAAGAALRRGRARTALA